MITVQYDPCKGAGVCPGEICDSIWTLDDTILSQGMKPPRGTVPEVDISGWLCSGRQIDRSRGRIETLQTKVADSSDKCLINGSKLELRRTLVDWCTWLLVEAQHCVIFSPQSQGRHVSEANSITRHGPIR